MLSERHRRTGLDRASSTEKSRERRQLSRKIRVHHVLPGRNSSSRQQPSVRPSVRPSEMNESRPSHERSSLVTIYANGVRMCIHPALLSSRPSALTLTLTLLCSRPSALTLTLTLLCSRSSAPSRAGARVAAGSAIGTVVHLLGQGRVGDEAGRRARGGAAGFRRRVEGQLFHELPGKRCVCFFSRAFRSFFI